MLVQMPARMDQDAQMARRMARCACCSANLNLGGGWMLSHVTVSNLWKFMISSSKHARFIICRCCYRGLIRARCEREEDL